jgi:hypothetical protein
MERTRTFVPVLAVLAVALILAAGCTGDTKPADTTPTATTPGARYAAGDVVRNPLSTGETAWLVIGYDAASDSYERALIYPNTGGSWGYRKDNRTEMADRAVMEKVYTERVATIALSSAPIETQTTAVTVVTTTRAALTTSVSPTATPVGKPYIERIIPDEGYAGTTVKVTDLVGKNFVTGTTVSISRNSTTLTASNVKIVSPTSITCDLAIPAGSDVGAWDLNVKNPDGQSYTFTNIFTVHKDTSVTSVTTSVNRGTVPISSIDPPVGHIGYYYPYTITGTGFQNGATVVLQKSGRPDIGGTSVVVEGTTSIKVGFSPPSGSFGAWDVLVTNPDASWGKLIEGFSIS